MRRILVAYDISEDALRGSIDRLLSGYLYRVQRSVFEGIVTAADIKLLHAKIDALEFGPTDSIRFYQICVTCSGLHKIAGNGMRIERLPYMIL